MPDTFMIQRRLRVLIPLLAAGFSASMVLASWSFYIGHRNNCSNKDATADLFHDVIVIATTPPRGSKPLTGRRLELRDEFRSRVFARIDLIRC